MILSLLVHMQLSALYIQPRHSQHRGRVHPSRRMIGTLGDMPGDMHQVSMYHGQPLGSKLEAPMVAISRPTFFRWLGPQQITPAQ